MRRLSDGQNPLSQAGALARAIALRRGDRLLDLGCGRAVSSIFFAREFGARVWATDRNVPPSENLRSIRRAGCEDLVYPLRADARDLPFAEEYFDAAVAIDSYYYFGTDERYLPYGAVRPVSGHIGVADVAFSRAKSEDDAPRSCAPRSARTGPSFIPWNGGGNAGSVRVWSTSSRRSPPDGAAPPGLRPRSRGD